MSQTLRNLAYVVRSIRCNDSNRGQRLRRLAMFAGWQLWKRLLRLPVVVPTFNGFRFIAYPDCQVSSGFIYYRVPDYNDISFLRKHINSGVLLDVGAHAGSVSILLADKIEHAILFEPNPATAARARENLAINRLSFEVQELALSDDSGIVELEDVPEASGCNRTVVGIQTDLPTRLVPRTTFDEFLRSRNPRRYAISAVKIDVEGHENSVLRGMKDFLREQRPRLIMFEYLQRTNLVETLRIFEDAGYTVFSLTSQGPALASQTAAPLQNLFACPEELSAEIGLPQAKTGMPRSEATAASA